MTFLELCQRLRQEVGIPGTGPSTVLSQTGELALLVDWIASSYTEIQQRHGGRWRWLRREFTLSTTASDGSYAYGDATDVTDAAAITRFRRWIFTDRDNPPKIYLTASGVGTERFLVYADYPAFRSVWKLGNNSTQTGYPTFVAQDPNNNVLLAPIPDDAYTVRGEYWMKPQTLAADADEPEMPDDFHMLIVYRAMEKYAGFNAAQEVMIRAKNEGQPMMRNLEADQLFVDWRFAGPLA